MFASTCWHPQYCLGSVTSLLQTLSLYLLPWVF
uniref:Uncharacterized protein n=1 Tax=Trichinella nativa TaxID=6335 RepID=A0A0V1JTB0_9BILA